MARTDLKVVGVVSRGHLQGAGTGGQVHISVADDGNLTVHQRQDHGFGSQIRVAFIFRVNGHGGVAQHGFRTGGGHDHRSGAVGKGIADVVEVAVQVFVLHLQVGQGRVAAAAPVDDVIPPVDQAFVVELDEYFPHRLGEPLVHGEPLPVPVAGGTQAFELVDDGTAIFLAPAPRRPR